VWILACQFQYVPPLSWGHLRNTQPCLFEGLQVLEWLARLAISLEVIQGNLLSELVAIFDVHDHPLWVIATRFGVVVGMLRVKCRLCRKLVSYIMRSREERCLTVSRMLLYNFHNPNYSRDLAVRVIEECIVSFLHIPHDIACCSIVSHPAVLMDPTIILPRGLRTPI